MVWIAGRTLPELLRLRIVDSAGEHERDRKTAQPVRRQHGKPRHRTPGQSGPPERAPSTFQTGHGTHSSLPQQGQESDQRRVFRLSHHPCRAPSPAGIRNTSSNQHSSHLVLPTAEMRAKLDLPVTEIDQKDDEIH